MNRARDAFWRLLGFKVEESDDAFTILFPRWLYRLDARLILVTQRKLLANPRNAGLRVRVDGRRLTVLR